MNNLVPVGKRRNVTRSNLGWVDTVGYHARVRCREPVE
jgi:hypothetical protein